MKMTIRAIAVTTVLALSGGSALAGGKKDKPDFDTLDTDKNGKLTAAELQAGMPDASEEKIQKKLKMGDKDNDGSLSKEEYMHHGKKDKHGGESH